MFLVVTTRRADSPMAAAMTPNAMCCATTSRDSGALRSLLGALLGLGAGLQRRRLGDGRHPLAEAVLVVQQVADVGLRVLELRAPEQGVERADLDADPAVHAEGVIDVEAVEVLHRPRLAALASRRRLVLVALDVDAPVRTLAGAQQANRAGLFLDGDHAAGPGRRRLFDMR